MAPPFLTNLGRGGSAHPCRQVLARVWGARQAQRIWEQVRALALAVAEALARHHPGLADLGLDVGLDRSGFPWLLEVNFRDQRWSLLAAGDRAGFYALYRNPLAYAAYLLGQGEREETG